MITVLAHGVFDLFHDGHVEHLKQVSTFGDIVWVSVVPDRFVQKRLPIYPEAARLRILHACRYVDKAFLCDAPGPEKLLKLLRPTIYVRSDEYLARDRPEYELIRELGIDVGFTRAGPPHTSDILARIRGL